MSGLEEDDFQHSNSRNTFCTPYYLKMRDHSLSSTEEVSQLSTSTSRGVFPQQNVCESDPSLLPKLERIARWSDWKKGRISLRSLKWRLVFQLTDEETSECPVNTLENVLGPCLIWTAGLKSLDTSKGMRSSMLQKVAMPDPC